MARIFVVEDDASLREELMRLLELQGHTALTGTAFDRIVDDVLGLFGGFCGRDSGIGPAQRAKTTIWN